MINEPLPCREPYDGAVSATAPRTGRWFETPALVVQWAEEERTAIEKGGD